MPRRIERFGTVIVAILMCLPILGHLMGFRGDIQDRGLEPIPVIDKSLKDWFAAFDLYLNDNYGFRGPLLQSNRVIRDLLGEEPDKVTFGEGDWLFSSNPSYRADFEGRGEWTADRVDAWIEALGTLMEIATERDIPFAAMIAVDKAQLYPEFVPPHWAGPASRRFRNELYNHPDAKKVGLIDIEGRLQQLKSDGVLVFHHRDTHWTTNGAYAAYSAALDALKPNFGSTAFQFDGVYTEFRPVILKDLEVAGGYQVTSEPPFMGIPLPPKLEFTLTEIPPITDAAKALKFQTPAYIMSNLGTEQESTILVFGDSFSNSIRPYLRTAFKNFIYINRRDGLVPIDEIEAVIDVYDVDAVLLINSERHAHTLDGPFVLTSAD